MIETGVFTSQCLYIFYNFPSNDTYPSSVNSTANYFTANTIDLYYYVSESSTSTDVATVEFLFPPVKYFLHTNQRLRLEKTGKTGLSQPS